MIGDPQLCRDRAAHCRALADNASNPLAREACTKLAKQWEAMALYIMDARAVLTAVAITAGPDPKKRVH